MGIVQVGLILGWIFFGGSFPGGNCLVGIIQVGVFMLPHRHCIKHARMCVYENPYCRLFYPAPCFPVKCSIFFIQLF